ncbi:MAG: ATP-binding protein [Bdellovibrionia bacterium]
MLNNSFDAVCELPEKWVRLEVLNMETHIEIASVDSGTGIAPQIAEKLMQPFFTTKEVGKGTGLGLSISKAIVQSHGGKLYLDGTSHNTRFVMKLPFKQSGQTEMKAA